MNEKAWPVRSCACVWYVCVVCGCAVLCVCVYVYVDGVIVIKVAPWCMGLANEIRLYIATSSLIGCDHTRRSTLIYDIEAEWHKHA